jgi:glycosyltransferase involved in cell wall biosynthesis
MDAGNAHGVTALDSSRFGTDPAPLTGPEQAAGPRPMAAGAGRPAVAILGTRGIPAAHGGFETLAERLAQHLAAQGWRVTVYCQREVPTLRRRFSSTTWRGIELVHVEVAQTGALATLAFDGHCVRHAAQRDAACLVLGYNGAPFLPWLRLRGRKILTNMDGIEWRRPKWNPAVRAYFWVAEWIAAWTSHRLIADHPAIADHLATRRPRSAITTIPYGGDPVEAAPTAPLDALGLAPDRYLLSVARIEPDNSILPIVRAFSRRRRGLRLVVVGCLDAANPYHRAVRAAAGDEVMFPGGLYDPAIVRALRFHARAYLHGHRVGGTNPSLVEALWAGNAVIAHDNVFNAWTTGPGQFAFRDEETLEAAIDLALTRPEYLAPARKAARRRAAEAFRWSDVLARYEAELLALARDARRAEGRSEPDARTVGGTAPAPRSR